MFRAVEETLWSAVVLTICTNQFHLLRNGRESLKLVSKMAHNKWNANFREEHTVLLFPEIVHNNDPKSRVPFTFQPDFPDTFCKW